MRGKIKGRYGVRNGTCLYVSDSDRSGTTDCSRGMLLYCFPLLLPTDACVAPLEIPE